MMGVTKYEDTAVLVQCKVYKCWIQWSGRPRVGRRKQRVETVTSAFGRKWGAAAQPEIGVGKLDRLEEEEKTPIDASNDVSEEEDFDRCRSTWQGGGEGKDSGRHLKWQRGRVRWILWQRRWGHSWACNQCRSPKWQRSSNVPWKHRESSEDAY